MTLAEQLEQLQSPITAIETTGQSVTLVGRQWTKAGLATLYAPEPELTRAFARGRIRVRSIVRCIRHGNDANQCEVLTEATGEVAAGAHACMSGKATAALPPAQGIRSGSAARLPCERWPRGRA